MRASRLVFVWFFFGGIGHFVFTDAFTSIVPPYVPFPREIVLATGVCEIAGALALFHPEAAADRWALLIALTVA